jgi:hypothetical protein
MLRACATDISSENAQKFFKLIKLYNQKLYLINKKKNYIYITIIYYIIIIFNLYLLIKNYLTLYVLCILFIICAANL